MQKENELLELINSKYASKFLAAKITIDNQVEVRVSPENLLATFDLLKNNQDFGFELFVNVTAVDYMDSDFMKRDPDTRYELVYHFLSLTSLKRLRLKVSVPENNLEVPSATKFWSGADFMESEVWDMYGIVFANHPNLRRVLMYPEFVGHPLRKDYPLQGKQPRVRMLSPEVHNTARDMQRPALVQIKNRQKDRRQAAN